MRDELNFVFSACQDCEPYKVVFLLINFKALKLDVPVDEKLSVADVTNKLLTHVPESAKK